MEELFVSIKNKPNREKRKGYLHPEEETITREKKIEVRLIKIVKGKRAALKMKMVRVMVMMKMKEGSVVKELLYWWLTVAASIRYHRG